MNREQLQSEALGRAQSGIALTNYPSIFAGFMAKGIPESEIKPRVNIFTYDAWRALGRQVRKGEHGVKVLTFIECDRKTKDAATGETVKRAARRPWGTTVFHISQTDLIEGAIQ